MGELKPPELERLIGIECYKTDVEGIGGRLKQQPEDFVVEEITQDGIILEVGKESIKDLSHSGGFVHCTLEKINWDTMRAVKEIARSLRVSQKRIGYAGTKDKKAVTTQRISISGVTIEDLQKISLKDLTLRDFAYQDDNIGLGNLRGNRFTITIRGIDMEGDEIESAVSANSSSLASGFPNFFGVQRFGVQRPITHLVGREIIRGNFERAVSIYLSEVFEGENSEAVEARRLLSETGDFKDALKNFPRNLGYEISMLNHLAVKPFDFKGALRVLPKGLSRMFVHGYQSYIYNKSLSRYIKRDIVVERLPLAGFESQVDEITQEVLEEEGVKLEEFRVKGMSELGSRGELRDCFIGVDDFILSCVGSDELNEGRCKAVVRFSLPAGAYATTLLREYMKNEYWLQDLDS
ncbi:MAG: tRNA pseudouridine(13) synthase TruD [Candidatus Altiarchaeota archaeon]